MLRNKNQETALLLSKRVSRDTVLAIHAFVMDRRAKTGIGQRSLARQVAMRFSVHVSEATISGWIHRKLVPFANEQTQFKPKPVPPKEFLQELYVEKGWSASDIAQKYRVSIVIAINWLKKYSIQTRTHIQSMNKSSVKAKLRDKALTKPTTDYKKLTPEKAYVFGVLAGDGYINEKGFKLEIRNDTEFIEEFSRCIEIVYGIKYKSYYYNLRDTYLLTAGSEIIAKDLLEHGDFRTFTWRVPKEIRESDDRSIITPFLRGLYDSDGSINTYYLTLTVASQQGVIDTQQLLSKLGIESVIKYYRPKYPTLYLTRKPNLRLFKDLIGFTINRKMERLINTYRLGW
jgi:hypothetical protein